MKLQFVMGRARSGKSHYMYDLMIEESEKHPEINYVFVVPEQASLSTQQELVSVHRDHALLGVEVMSFKRLALKVFEELGVNVPTVLDEVGKSMLIRKALISVGDELLVYKGSSRRPGFIDKMKSMLDEMTQYSVSDQALMAAATDLDNAQLCAKLHDLTLISRAFNEELSHTYITAESILPEFAKHICESEFLKNAVLVFDGFSDFTPAQLDVLGELLSSCMEIYVVLDMTKEQLCGRKSENALFNLSRTIIDDLSALAEKSGVLVLDPIWMEDGKDYYESPEIRFLERSFEQSPAVFGERTRDIFVMEAENPSAEVEQVCAHILALVREQGMHYGDMAIITTDLDTYGEALEKKLLQAEIPFFSDNRHSIMGNVGVEAVLSALLCVGENFSYESVFRYLKCGLFSDLNLIDLMENYCIAAGLKGKSNFKRTWEWCPRFISEEELKRLNEEKEKLLAPLFRLNDSIKGRLTVSERLDALRGFLADISYDECMEELKKELISRGETELSQEYEQIPSCMENLFSQMEEMMGDQRIPLKELCDVIETSLDQLSVGVVPPTIDNLVIADMRRSRLENVSVIFVVGMNEGMFPAQKSGAGILSDIDREALRERDIKLAPTAKKESFTDKFYIYRTFTKPSCKLYMSYSRQSGDAKTLHPSYVLGQIRRIFPRLTIIPESEKIYHARQGLEVLARETGRQTPLYKFYQDKPEYHYLLNMIEAGKNIEKSDIKISAGTAEKLFGSPAITSVSHLEKFAACEMSHFLRYGLRLNERQEHTLRALDFGNLYHDAFDIIFREAKKEGLEIENLGNEDIERLTELGINKALENFQNDIFESSSKNEYTLSRMRDVLKLNLEAVTMQLNAGKYKPVSTEMAFGMMGSDEHPPLAIENSPFSLMGKIDRLDEAVASDGTVYARIVDYKTGNTTFDYTKLVNGLQLQTMLYLLAVSTEENTRPAGAFYYHVDEPIVDLDLREIEGLSEEQIRAAVHEKQLEALRLNGMLNIDGESVELFEKELLPNQASRVLAGLKLKKDGDFTATSPTVSEKTMNSLMDIAKEQTKRLGDGILAGNIDTNPYVYSHKKPCDYCEYRQICGFNAEFRGYQYRRIKTESILKSGEE